MSQTYQRLGAIIVALVLTAVSAMANYIVREITGDVQVKQGQRTVPATVGMEVKASDLIIIPDDATVKIIDTRDSQIYESTAAGQTSVTRIIFDAKKKASDNSEVIKDKLRMGSNNKEGVVYVEKGKVTRALRAYDPAAEQVQLDVDQLSRRVYAMLSNPSQDALNDQESTIVIRHHRNDRNGLSFMVENTMPFPIYFNVVKTVPDYNGIEISEVGQPVGSYALQPDQSIARTQVSGLTADGNHMLIVTNYYFDVDELLTKLNELISSGAPVEPDTQSFPLLIRKI